MKKWSRMGISYLVLMFVLAGCSKGFENIESVSVYTMKNFSTVQEDTLMTFIDSKAINEFTKAGYSGYGKSRV